MIFLLAVLVGYLLDLLIGDPEWIPHPVNLIGKLITKLEARLRAKYPATKEGELQAGKKLAILVPLITFVVSGAICWGIYAFDHIAGTVIQIILCWQCLASRDLAKHSREVYFALEDGSLEDAQEAVGEIVGRDTDRLNEAGVTRAAIESVAESSSDGVIAPMFFMLIGGAPLAWTYKAINTMDSLVGYKTKRYIYFGFYAAKLDDIVNLIPSRLAALCWIAAAFLTRNDYKNAKKIWKRDNAKHPSPNAGQTESACAGALDIYLGGPSYYFGRLVKKPYIGDNLRPVEAEDILRANRMMYVAGFLYLFLASMLCTLVFIVAMLILY